MSTRVTIRFYKVNETPGQPSFTDCLDAVFAVPHVHQRGKFLEFANHRIECGGRVGTMIYGDFYRLQEHDHPPKVGLQSEAVPLDLGPGNALGHRVAFGYHTGKRVLGIEKRAAAPSATRLAQYAGLFRNAMGIVPTPIVKPDELGKLNHVRPRQFNIRIAEPRDLSVADGDQLSFKQSLEAIQRVVGAPYITLQVGMGRRKGEVSRDNLTRVADWLRGNYLEQKGNIQDLTIEGRDEHGASVLNLLDAHLGDSTQMDLPGDDLAVNYERRRAYIETLFQRFDQQF
jgi:hypothetical protein